jgi:chorismate dehydratase
VTRSDRVRVGAVGYLNARPLVYRLEESPRFAVRYDVPSECARLLHAAAIDIGLIPSIEYLRGGPYAIVPDIAIASEGRVASVILYTRKRIADVHSIAMDTSSRASVALLRVLCARLFGIQPAIEAHAPDIDQMLARCDAALIIGDHALFLDARGIETIDLGDAWTSMTGLPFVYAFWAGRPDILTTLDIDALQRARDEGVARPGELAQQYLHGRPDRYALGTKYLRDNIKYHLGDRERAGLEAFYSYAVEAGVVAATRRLRFFGRP